MAASARDVARAWEAVAWTSAAALQLQPVVVPPTVWLEATEAALGQWTPVTQVGLGLPAAAGQLVQMEPVEPVQLLVFATRKAAQFVPQSQPALVVLLRPTSVMVRQLIG